MTLETEGLSEEYAQMCQHLGIGWHVIRGFAAK